MSTTPIPVSERFKDPAGYQASPALEAAVEVALLLGMPLLLTGEPGCGKTSVAGWLAWRQQLDAPLEFNVKSTTSGRDLLYEFDELARFRDAQAEERSADLTRYLRLNALGQAILLAGRGGEEVYTRLVPAGLKLAASDVSTTRADLIHSAGGKARGSPLAERFGRRQVVLIDELDKAPRDTPNDLLHEILEMRFQLRELDCWIGGDPALRPVVVITSNSEKSLPEPFLRRCVFHHIATPDADARQRIVERRLHPFAQRGERFGEAMRLFDRFTKELGRAPGTAELLAWLTVLEARTVTALAEGATPSLRRLAGGTLGAVAKTREDLDRADAALQSLPVG